MIKSAVLAIGTEITSGDLIDSNSSWIAKQLLQHGIETSLHLSTRDQEEDILTALDYCRSQAQMIFVTGGLGPTSDDLTRTAVAKWSKRELKFSEEAWTRIQETLNERKTPILPRHKVQAWFPNSANVLNNSVGTADGFFLELDQGLKVWTLPGPPRELKAIWADHILPEIGKVADPAQGVKVHRWRVFAVPESELAELTEPLVENTGFNIGFRASFPYVEIKLFYPPSDQEKAEKTIEKIDSSLGDFLQVGEHPVENLLEDALLMAPALTLKDEATFGALSCRLGTVVQNLGIHGKYFEMTTGEKPSSPGVHISTKKLEEALFRVEVHSDKNYQEDFAIPEAFNRSPARAFNYISERTLLFVADCLAKEGTALL